jgi:hypothetical protein
MWLSDLLFTLDPPRDWEVRLQVTLIEPAAPLQDLPVDMIQQAPPRANVVVSRVPATSPTTKVACQEFLEQTAKTVPHLKISAIEDFVFADGAEGSSVEINFPATPQVRLFQLHAFRIDAGVLTQLVATWAERQSKERRDTLVEFLKTFRR